MKIGAAILNIEGMTLNQINEELISKYKAIENRSLIHIKITINYDQNYAKIVGRKMDPSVSDIMR